MTDNSNEWTAFRNKNRAEDILKNIEGNNRAKNTLDWQVGVPRTGFKGKRRKQCYHAENYSLPPRDDTFGIVLKPAILAPQTPYILKVCQCLIKYLILFV